MLGVGILVGETGLESKEGFELGMPAFWDDMLRSFGFEVFCASPSILVRRGI